MEQEGERPFKAYLALALVIFAATMGPIVIREAQGVGLPSLIIITARLILTSMIVFPFALRRDLLRVRFLKRKEWLFIGFSGLFFALNLLLLFFALEYTSVFVTGVLRRTTPIWLIWLEMAFLGAIFPRGMWVGLGLTVLGGVLVGVGSSSELATGSQPLLGGGLALLGSVSMGLYMLIGRGFRMLLPSLVYSWLVFIVATVIMIAVVWLTATPYTGYSGQAYLWILIVTLLTQFLGHIPINYSLRYFHATTISLFMQISVVAAGLVAFLLFQEVPTFMQLLGSAVIIFGVLLANQRQITSRQPTPM